MRLLRPIIVNSTHSLLIRSRGAKVSIDHVIDFHRGSADDLATTINGLSLAVILLRGGGEIVFANDPAKDAIAKGSILKKSDGRRLTATSRKADMELQEALIVANCGDSHLGTKGIAIGLNGHSPQPQVAHVLSLKSGRLDSSVKGLATAAVLVRPLTHPKPSPLEYMARFYKLTACEIKVLEATFGEGSVSEISETLGVSLATVNTHLNHLYSQNRSVPSERTGATGNGFRKPAGDQLIVHSVGVIEAHMRPVFDRLLLKCRPQWKVNNEPVFNLIPGAIRINITHRLFAQSP